MTAYPTYQPMNGFFDDLLDNTLRNVVAPEVYGLDQQWDPFKAMFSVALGDQNPNAQVATTVPSTDATTTPPKANGIDKIQTGLIVVGFVVLAGATWYAFKDNSPKKTSGLSGTSSKTKHRGKSKKSGNKKSSRTISKQKLVIK